MNTQKPRKGVIMRSVDMGGKGRVYIQLHDGFGKNNEVEPRMAVSFTTLDGKTMTAQFNISDLAEVKHGMIGTPRLVRSGVSQ